MCTRILLSPFELVYNKAVYKAKVSVLAMVSSNSNSYVKTFLSSVKNDNKSEVLIE